MNNSKNVKLINKKLRELEKKNSFGLSHNQLRVIVALERLIARFEADPILSQHLVFKGGFALLKSIDSARFTKDLDASFHKVSLNEIENLVIEAAYKDLEDGLFFYDIQKEEIKIEHDYPGVRYIIGFQITDSRESVKKIHKLSRVHFDMALGELVSDSIITAVMPSILDHSEPIFWQVYAPEQIFSEKLQTAVVRGQANSRAKDFFDLVQLFNDVKNSAIIAEMIKRIFFVRNTALPNSFYDFFKDQETFVLESSWRSVKVVDKPTFSNLWSKFLEITIRIDQIIRSKNLIQ